MPTNLNTSKVEEGNYVTVAARQGYTIPGGAVVAPSYTLTDSGPTRLASKKLTTRTGTVTPHWGGLLSHTTRYQVNAITYSQEYINYRSGHEVLKTTNEASYIPAKYETTTGHKSVKTTNESSWDMPQYVGPTQSQIDALDRQVRSKLLLKLKDQKVNLQQVLAERAQTAQLLVETVKSLAQCVSNLKRGNLLEAARSIGVHVGTRAHKRYKRSWRKDQSKAVANGWIGMQYGWKPLLDDVRGAAESLAKLLNETPNIVQRVTVNQVLRINKSSYARIGPDYLRNQLTETTCEYTIKYTVYYKLSSTVSQWPVALGLTNPLSIAWELCPWSFVVDWFLPLGNFISTFDATVGIDFNSGCKTVFQRLSARAEWKSLNVPYGSTYIVVDTDEQAYRQKVQWDRSVLFSFPNVGMPAFKDPFSSVHVANALALLRQQFR